MEDLGAAVERIMADPAFGKMVKEFGGGDVGDLRERLPQVMETLGPLLGGMDKNQGEGAGEGDTADGEPALREVPADDGSDSAGPPVLTGHKSWNRTDAERLFLALKPYLGDRRRDLVDRCLSVMRMGALLKASGLTSGLSEGRGSREP